MDIFYRSIFLLGGLCFVGIGIFFLMLWLQKINLYYLLGSSFFVISPIKILLGLACVLFLA